MDSKMSYMVVDCETIPDIIADDLKPKPKYGNTKDPLKREKIEADWDGSDGQIKALSLAPATNKVVSLQIWSSFENGFLNTGEMEGEMLSTFWEAMTEHTLVAGFNHFSFDLPIFKMRSMMIGIEPTGRIDLARYKNFPFYDVMQELAGWDNTRWKSQDWWAKRLGCAEDKGGMDGSKVYEAYKDGRIDEIHSYCKSDVLELKAIFDKIYRHYPVRGK